LAQHKSSFGPRASSLLFDLEGAPHPAGPDATIGVVELVGEVDYSAEQIFDASSGGTTKRSKREEVKTLIINILLDGPKPAETLQNLVVWEGYSERTFRRGREELAKAGTIQPFQDGGAHWWKLTEVPDAPPSSW
jgi:hypothetical protein